VNDLDTLLGIAQAAVGQAAELVRTHAPGAVTAKGDRDMVTELDVMIEQRIRAQLKESIPDISFLVEEQGKEAHADDSLMWTLDPIDGTASLTHGIPLVAVSLGLLHHRRPVVAAVELPCWACATTPPRGTAPTATKPRRSPPAARLPRRAARHRCLTRHPIGCAASGEIALRHRGPASTAVLCSKSCTATPRWGKATAAAAG
jgi:myo-inositol-1(or 4)-monophosphatase